VRRNKIVHAVFEIEKRNLTLYFVTFGDTWHPTAPLKWRC